MWTFLPMVSLLARLVVGNIEIGNNFFDMTRPRNDDNKFENQTEKFGPWMDDVSKEWNSEPDISLAMETGRKELDPGGSVTEMADETKGKAVDLFKIVAKRRDETVDSWLDSTTNKMGSPQEKKDPWTYWLGDKRISSHGQNPDIRRPIRVPFNSWGGKRGRVAYPRRPESNRFADDRIGHDHVGALVDGYSVKRRAGIERTGWKTPFSSWGGKRARNANARESDGDEDGDENGVWDQDRENDSGRSSMRMSMTTSPYLDLSVGSWPVVHRVLGLVGDEFPKREKAERFKDGSNAIRDTIELAAKDDGWVGKANNFPHRKTAKNNGNWFVQTYRLMTTKKAQPDHNKTLTFGPWHGKRNLKTYTLRFGDEYLEIPKRYTKEGTGFFPWGG